MRIFSSELSKRRRSKRLFPEDQLELLPEQSFSEAAALLPARSFFFLRSRRRRIPSVMFAEGDDE